MLSSAVSSIIVRPITMSGTVLELSVSGAKLRPLLNLFSICVKLSSGGFFLEPAATSLAFRAVSDSKSSHFIAEVPSAYFDAYKYVRPPGMEPLHLQLVSRGVAASILRYCPSITRLVLVYETSSSTIAAPPLNHANAPQDGLGASQDMISFILYCHSGTTKTFRLHLGEQTVSEKADVSSVDAQMTFRAAAEPRLWTSLVTNFPPTTKLWTIHPTELRLTLTDDGDDVGGTSGSDAHNKNVAVVSADSRSFSTYSYPHPPAIDAHNGALTPGGAASRASAGSVQLPGKTFELKPLKYLLLLADHLQLHIQLSSGGANVLAVHIEGIRRPGAGGAPPGGVDHQMVSYASLLIAAVDFASPAQQLTNPQRQQSIPRMSSSSSSHTPGGAFQRSRPSMGGGGASSNIRSASNFGDHQIDPIMSAAPTAFGNLRTQTSATREASLLAPASTYALEGQSSVAFTAVAPSFVEETPSPQKRRRDDDDDSFCIPGSEARSTASSNPKSYVEGTGRSDPQRSASREGEGIQPSFASSSVAASHVTQVPPHALAPPHNEQIPNILMQLFPLDFDALASDEDDGDDDHFALETFIASRRVDGTEQLNRSGATPAEGFTAASAYTMIHGTQR